MTGVSRLHSQGITGKGIKIGVLDTGVDYRHPALGGGFGPGFKIAGGYDLVGDDYFNQMADSDPLATCSGGGHGTHVSGIIGAVDPEGEGFGLVGVAPEASIYMYRVFSCAGGASDDVLLEAMNRAAADGVSVISMSLGEVVYWQTNDVFSEVTKALNERDISLVMAAGNSGQGGPLMASAPAINPGVISVGSINSHQYPTCYNGHDTMGESIRYCSVLPLPDNGLDGIACEIPTLNQIGDPAWYAAIEAKYSDMSKVVFVYSEVYGSIAWINSHPANVRNMFIYQDPDETDVDPDPPTPYGQGWDEYFLTWNDGQKILAGKASQGDAYRLIFTNQSAVGAAHQSGGYMSLFSEYGPTQEGSLKPTLSAPGRWILSTWPVFDGQAPGSYAVISGTSMATPHVAGCVALIRSRFPDMSAAEVFRLVQSTSRPLVLYSEANGPNPQGLLDTVAHQGAGMLRCEVAIRSAEKSALSVSEFTLGAGDSKSLKLTQTIVIENKSGAPKTYQLSHQPAGAIDRMPYFPSWPDTTYGFGPPTAGFTWIPWDLTYSSGADVSFDSPSGETSFTVDAGAKSSVNVTVALPPDANPDKLPIYSGFVTIRASCERYTVPYNGLLTPSDVLDHSNAWYPASATNPPAPELNLPWFPMITSRFSNVRNNDIATYTGATSQDYPAFWMVVRRPSYYIRVDAVPVDTPFIPVTYGYDVKAPLPQNVSLVKPPLDIDQLDKFVDVQSYGSILQFAPSETAPVPIDPSRYIRTPEGMLNGWGWWDGYLYLANGTTYSAPNGDYRLLIRALKSAEDTTQAASYDSWLSPVVRLSR
ncbi:subtilisin-like protein [Thozetella sp. PMI_491]|nr:subtilisin-like protein [Thozetella sp. PMI_491]